MNIPRPFAPLIEACRARGISRSAAHLLARDGRIETFLLSATGRRGRRYVYLDSLDTLGERLGVKGTQDQDSLA